MPVGDVPGWRQVFAENFSVETAVRSFPGPSYGSRWGVYEKYHDTSGAGLYAESRVVSVRNGVLDMHLRTENGQPLVAAPYPLIGGSLRGQRYGKFTVRFRAEPVSGYKTAWLLWPVSDKWKEGEIDFPEGSLDGTIAAYNHCIGRPTENCFEHDTGVPFDNWHTASIEWTPAGVRYILDEEVVGESSVSPSVPMRWVLQTETDNGKPPAKSSGHVLVDWVVVYALA
jgi:hypothetical protein